MYYPYFRGKQYELIAIRETAECLAASKFVPVIEPVREALIGLERALNSICDVHGEAIVVVNPYHGDLKESGSDISDLLNGYVQSPSVSAGILLRQDTSLEAAVKLCQQHKHHKLSLIHSGFIQGKELAQALAGKIQPHRNIFIDGHGTKIYRKHFSGSERILIRDGFKRQRNRDYPPVELFSDLNVTYDLEGMNGFGDFLTVGDGYSESGGPAYAVAIHLTFIDSDQDEAIGIYHFVSISQDTPTDPAGKFSEALNKLIKLLDSGNSKLYETSTILELRELHKKGHFPGLGYLKKLSMIHHIETISTYLAAS